MMAKCRSTEEFHPAGGFNCRMMMMRNKAKIARFTLIYLTSSYSTVPMLRL